jgi:hypothetical protein
VHDEYPEFGIVEFPCARPTVSPEANHANFALALEKNQTRYFESYAITPRK